MTEYPAETQGSVYNRWGESGGHGVPTGSSFNTSYVPTRSLPQYKFKEYEFRPWLELWIDSSLRFWTWKREKQDGVVEEQIVPMRPTNRILTLSLAYDLTLYCWASLGLRSLTVERGQRCLPHRAVVITEVKLEHPGTRLSCAEFPVKVSSSRIIDVTNFPNASRWTSWFAQRLNLHYCTRITSLYRKGIFTLPNANFKVLLMGWYSPRGN